MLAAPFGTANLMPVPVVAARSGAPLTRADVTAMAVLQGRLRAVSGVDKVVDLGRASGARAEQLVVLVFGKSSGPRARNPGEYYPGSRGLGGSVYGDLMHASTASGSANL